MEHLEFLEQELKMMLDNIKRIKKYQKENFCNKWTPSQSNVVGEFKHRTITLKARLTLASNIRTNELFK